MADVIKRGTGRRALSLNRTDIAGKTGTTNEAKDTWFNGFTPNLVATVWVGFDQERPLGEAEEGARTALPIWIDFMREALKGVAEQHRAMPDGIVTLRISPETGTLVRAENANGIPEMFIADHLPSARTQPAGAARPSRARPAASRSSRECARSDTKRRSDNLRLALAQEAARIMAEHGIRDFLVAKRKAAERLGLSEMSAILPKNSEIEEALAGYQRLFGGENHVQALEAQRRAALAAMRYLKEFEPRLVGSVLSGTATEHSDVQLHLFADRAESVTLKLIDEGIPHEVTEKRVKLNAERVRAFPGVRFEVDDQPIEATGVSDRRDPPGPGEPGGRAADAPGKCPRGRGTPRTVLKVTPPRGDLHP